MRWSGVLFDLFGTIVEPFPLDRHERALSAAADSIGLDPLRCSRAWAADYASRVRGRSGAIADQLLTMAGAEGLAPEAARLSRAREGYEAFTADLMRPMPGALRTLERLEALKVPVGLVSNAAPDFVTAFEGAHLRQLFGPCVSSCTVALAKPQVEIYLLAAARLGVEPDRALFVGDGSDNELDGAAEAGLAPVLVEIDASNTYDPERETVRTWSGPRLAALPELLDLLM